MTITRPGSSGFPPRSADAPPGTTRHSVQLWQLSAPSAHARALVGVEPHALSLRRRLHAVQDLAALDLVQVRRRGLTGSIDDQRQYDGGPGRERYAPLFFSFSELIKGTPSSRSVNVARCLSDPPIALRERLRSRERIRARSARRTCVAVLRRYFSDAERELSRRTSSHARSFATEASKLALSRARRSATNIAPALTVTVSRRASSDESALREP